MRRRTLLQGAAASLLVPLAAPAIAQPAKTAALRFVPQANLSVLDPIWTSATVTTEHGFYVFDTLYGADAKGVPQPQMAEGHSVSADGRVWTFRLRDGLVFHDGTPVRGVDCAASLERWSKRDSFGQLLAKVVEKWGAPDDRTLEIRLTQPFPLLLDAICATGSNIAFIMPERLAKTDANKQVTEMVGSGPYRFLAKEYNSGSRVAYEKFDGYRPRAEPASWMAGGKVAHFPRVEWNIIPDPATAAAALQNNEADWWERPLPDLMPMLKRAEGVAVQIADPGGRMAIMRLNCLQAPFKDVKLRQAVRLAVNQEDYMRASRGDDASLWTVCRSLFAKGNPYHEDERDLMPADPKAAMAMLKAAGYAGEKVVVINPTDFPDIGPLGQVTAEMLKKIGMNVDLQESDWGTVVQRRSKRGPVEEGGWSIFHTTVPAVGWDNPAVSPMVRGQGEKGWFGWWRSEAAEQMTAEWLAATDPAMQKKVATALGRLALDQVATVPLGQFYLQTAFRKSITGILQGPIMVPWNIRSA
ncbi:MAG: ABC transporter substrate-binding protein [Rhodospirillales bacterium 70-18]|nr:ABC transporter substrate-binding protein [Rhodospirillales bacterium]OJY73525.1 MAG: ABC transporter substrate-binding protein [Rhodospirillales bacterium 70-18]